MTRVITKTTEIPFTNDYYDQDMTVEEAVAYEESAEIGDWADHFFEDLTGDQVQTTVEVIEKDE